MVAPADPRLAHVAGPATEPILDISIGQALRAAAARWPDKTALVDGGSGEGVGPRWSFAALLDASERVARALLNRFAPGDHVAIWVANCPEWVHVEFGAALAGMTLVTVNPAYLGDELAYVLRQSQARGLIVQDHFRGRDLVAVAEEARRSVPEPVEIIPLSSWDGFLEGGRELPLPAIAADAVAQIQYTSGTTGTPKGARLTHRNLVNNGRIYARTIGAGEDDVWINPMPMFHTAGCGLVTLGALQTGGTHVLPRLFDPACMLGLFEAEHGTVMLSVPTMLIRVLDHPSLPGRDLSSWRLTTLGGAPVPPELVRQAQSLGLKVAIGFGQTEASPYLTHTLPDDPHPDWVSTVGPPMAGTEIKIFDLATGETAMRGEIGEICARGYSIMKDYFDQPDATAAALDPDGWLHTGDLGSIDAHGYCRVHGRLKDMIIRGGENIYPREIEDVLFEHPAVAGVSVVGVPDADWGEVAVAFVQFHPGARVDEQELDAHCRSRLAGFKVPRLWRFVEQFPQTASGKIQKFALREIYIGEAGRPAS